MCNIEEKRPGTILHGALPAYHSDARQNLRVAKQLGRQGATRTEWNNGVESVCNTTMTSTKQNI